MTERERLIHIIRGLIANIRATKNRYGWEYEGGMPLQFALVELQKMGIPDVDEKGRNDGE